MRHKYSIFANGNKDRHDVVHILPDDAIEKAVKHLLGLLLPPKGNKIKIKPFLYNQNYIYQNNTGHASKADKKRVE